jgi:hypothetical protein
VNAGKHRVYVTTPGCMHVLKFNFLHHRQPGGLQNGDFFFVFAAMVRWTVTISHDFPTDGGVFLSFISLG